MHEGHEVDEPVVLAAWQVSSPAAGSRDALNLILPRPLDRAMLDRAVGVILEGVPVAGKVEIDANETTWDFVPAAPWAASPHELVVLAELEDPQGNRIDQAIEVNPAAAHGGTARPERYVIPFTPRH